MIKENSNLKNECIGCSRHPVRFDCLIGDGAPITNTSLTRLGGHKPVRLRRYQTINIRYKHWNIYLGPHIARG